MKTTKLLFCSASVFVGLFSGPPARASEDSLVTTVYANARRDYVREKNPDGSLKRETYVIGNGGYASGISADPSIDKVSFPDLVRLMAGYLARQSYVPAPPSQPADLLLVISWGTTEPFDDSTFRTVGLEKVIDRLNQFNLAMGHRTDWERLAGRFSPDSGVGGTVAGADREDLLNAAVEMQMFNDMRAKADEYNAQLLGYVSELNRTNDMTRFAGNGTYYNDLISDIENERYYVIVSAYDYRAAQEKKRKLMWTTRVSIQAQGNRFDQSVAAMLASASGQFGRGNDTMVRRYLEGVVGLGEFKVVGVVPDSAAKDKPAERK